MKTEKDFKNILMHSHFILYERGEEKDREYGPFHEAIARAAQTQSNMCNKKITTDDYYKGMISLKTSRLSYNTKYDTILDGITYLASYYDWTQLSEEEKLKIEEKARGKV